MTRITSKFAQLKERNEKALVPFFFAGDPDIDTTYDLVLKLEQSGADIIELGIPYTDPLADGPVNQAASVRALKNGINLRDVLALVEKLRRKTQIPIVFLLYFNCVLQYDVEQFLADCEKAGVDGLVIPDLPYEERQPYKDVFAKYDVDIIPLVTPVSNERIRFIVKNSSGFVYCVTSTGTTGVRSSFKTDFGAFLGEVKKHTDTPRVLGFGISTPEHVRSLKGYAEGLIVGSAVVKKMADAGSPQDLLSSVSGYIAELKAALK